MTSPRSQASVQTSLVPRPFVAISRKTCLLDWIGLTLSLYSSIATCSTNADARSFPRAVHVDLPKSLKLTFKTGSWCSLIRQLGDVLQ